MPNFLRNAYYRTRFTPLGTIRSSTKDYGLPAGLDVSTKLPSTEKKEEEGTVKNSKSEEEALGYTYFS
jgi:hypothetical protein